MPTDDTSAECNLAAVYRYLAAVEAGATGDELAAHAVFFELRDGRIAAQRNYDCFDPW